MRTDESEMLEEYDFSHAVRNPYAERMRNGSNLVLIEPELFALFPRTEAVNDALRLLVRAGTQAVRASSENESNAR